MPASELIPPIFFYRQSAPRDERGRL
jgi:hypothetical protein